MPNSGPFSRSFPRLFFQSINDLNTLQAGFLKVLDKQVYHNQQTLNRIYQAVFLCKKMSYSSQKITEAGAHLAILYSFSSAAFTKALNKPSGWLGRDLNSGWY